MSLRQNLKTEAFTHLRTDDEIHSE